MYKFIAIVGSALAITVAPSAPAAVKSKDIGKGQVDPWVYDMTKRSTDWAPLSGRPKNAPEPERPWGWKPAPKDDFVPAPKKESPIPKPADAAAAAAPAAPAEGAAAAPAAPAEAAAAPALAAVKK